VSEARQAILDRIAASTGAAAEGPPSAPAYRRTGDLDAEQRVELFCRRAAEYRAEVRRVAGGELHTAIASICARRDATRLIIPPGLPDPWRSTSVELVEDHGQSARELDRYDGALTGCTVAIAETGTIILAGGPAEGRRVLTLVPDLHVCVVLERLIVELLPEALAKLAADGLERRPLTFISGPSATSDIELSRVEGVHGPRDLVVIVVKELP
jgi:L-lactate dehydrogenase complex protein LldG